MQIKWATGDRYTGSWASQYCLGTVSSLGALGFFVTNGLGVIPSVARNLALAPSFTQGRIPRYALENHPMPVIPAKAGIQPDAD
jgi:hypothetical protein